MRALRSRIINPAPATPAVSPSPPPSTTAATAAVPDTIITPTCGPAKRTRSQLRRTDAKFAMLQTPARPWSKAQSAAKQRQRKKRKLSHDGGPIISAEPSPSKKPTVAAPVTKEDQAQKTTQAKKRKGGKQRGGPVAKKRMTRSQTKKVEDGGGTVEDEGVDVDMGLQPDDEAAKDEVVEALQAEPDNGITAEEAIVDDTPAKDVEMSDTAQSDGEEEEQKQPEKSGKLEVAVELVDIEYYPDNTLQERPSDHDEELDLDEAAADKQSEAYLDSNIESSEEAKDVPADETPQRSTSLYDATEDNLDDQSSTLSDPPSGLSDFDFLIADKADSEASGDAQSVAAQSSTDPSVASDSGIDTHHDSLSPEEVETTDINAVKEGMRKTAGKIKINLKKLRDLGVDLDADYTKETSTDEETEEESEEEEGSEFEVDEHQQEEDEDEDEDEEYEEESTVRDEESTEVIKFQQSEEVQDNLFADDASEKSQDTSHTEETIVVRAKPTRKSTTKSAAQSALTKQLARVPHVHPKNATVANGKSVRFAPDGVEVIQDSDPTEQAPPAKKSPEVFHIGGRTIIDDTGDDDDEWEEEYAKVTGNLKRGELMKSAKGLTVEQTVKAWQRGNLHHFHREGRTPGMPWVPPWLRK